MKKALVATGIVLGVAALTTAAILFVKKKMDELTVTFDPSPMEEDFDVDEELLFARDYDEEI